MSCPFQKNITLNCTTIFLIIFCSSFAPSSSYQDYFSMIGNVHNILQCENGRWRIQLCLQLVFQLLFFVSGVYVHHSPAAFTSFHVIARSRHLSCFGVSLLVRPYNGEFFTRLVSKWWGRWVGNVNSLDELSESIFFFWFNVHGLQASLLHYRCHWYYITFIIERGHFHSRYVSERGYYDPAGRRTLCNV